MSKDNIIEAEGKVLDVLPNQMFKVKLENGHEVICYASGKIRKNKIRVIMGDSVTVELSPYDLTKGRVTYRHR